MRNCITRRLSWYLNNFSTSLAFSQGGSNNVNWSHIPCIWSRNSLIDCPDTCFMLWRASCSGSQIFVVEYWVLSKCQTSLAVSKRANWSLIDGIEVLRIHVKIWWFLLSQSSSLSRYALSASSFYFTGSTTESLTISQSLLPFKKLDISWDRIA